MLPVTVLPVTRASPSEMSGKVCGGLPTRRYEAGASSAVSLKAVPKTTFIPSDFVEARFVVAMREFVFYQTDFGEKPVEHFLAALEPAPRAKVVRNLELLRTLPFVPSKF